VRVRPWSGTSPNLDHGELLGKGWDEWLRCQIALRQAEELVEDKKVDPGR
jgi:hypothetical protein